MEYSEEHVFTEDETYMCIETGAEKYVKWREAEDKKEEYRRWTAQILNTSDSCDPGSPLQPTMDSLIEEPIEELAKEPPEP